MAKTIKITDDGLKKLQEELENLKTEGRADIAEKIKKYATTIPRAISITITYFPFVNTSEPTACSADNVCLITSAS